jgi:DNA-binding transcriptional LysR family regulator
VSHPGDEFSDAFAGDEGVICCALALASNWLPSSRTRAAQRLHMSQPATSTAPARLRRQLEDPILVKDGRSLRPTPRALALVAPLRSVLATVERRTPGCGSRSSGFPVSLRGLADPPNRAGPDR